MHADASIQLGHFENGYLVRVVGRGTMAHSPAFRAVVSECIDGLGKSVCVDLTSCEYLDSTFLGCLVHLQKATKQSSDAELSFVADSEKRRQLFAKCMLDRLLNFAKVVPQVDGEFVNFESPKLESREFGEHVLRCHQRLVDLGDELAVEYKPIVERLRQELGEVD